MNCVLTAGALGADGVSCGMLRVTGSGAPAVGAWHCCSREFAMPGSVRGPSTSTSLSRSTTSAVLACTATLVMLRFCISSDSSRHSTQPPLRQASSSAFLAE